MNSTYNPSGGTFTGLEAGMVLRDRYEIVSLRGHGAFGAVYKAVDRGLDEPRTVAVKLIHPMVAADVRALKRIKREVAIARELNHPSVVGVWELAEWRDFTFIVMQYIEGPNIDDRIAGQAEDRLSPELALKYLGDISSGLDYLHGQDPPVIHRDLKPSNILIEKRTDRAVITDFGLAREIKDTMSRVSMADTSGSPPYMAPEVWDNKRPTIQTDIYALGIMVYEMLSGELPFRGPDYGYQHRNIEAEPVDGLPDPLNRTILKALAKAPAERYASAGEFVATIEAAIVGKAADKAEEKRTGEEALNTEERWRDQERTEEEDSRKVVGVAERRRETETRPVRRKSRTGLYAAIAALVLVAAVAAGLIVYSSMEATRRQERIEVQAKLEAAEKKAEEERKRIEAAAQAEAQRKAEEARLAEEKRRAEAAKLAESEKKAEEERKRREAAQAEVQRKAEEARLAEQKRRAEEAGAKAAAAEIKSEVVARDGRFVKYANGTVTDTTTGLMWAAKDNGEDISWHDAKRYCENLTLGGYSNWRLPTQNELESLYKARVTTYMGNDTGIIRLTDRCPWASKFDGSYASQFDFGNGIRVRYYLSESSYGRVLSVRSDK